MNNNKIEKIIAGLKTVYMPGKFRFADPFKVLISVMLSQRTKDENTYKVAMRLFSTLGTPEKLSAASEKTIKEIIKSSGFYRVKAKNIKKVSQILLARHNGKVPSGFDDLMKLPGVGRKTANCVLVFAFNKPAIPVDTHVHRISNRLRLVKTKTPEKTEKALSKIIPRKYWIPINELMVRFGQKICKPVNPQCPSCPINNLCPSSKL
jgi:endonuclease-3